MQAIQEQSQSIADYVEQSQSVEVSAKQSQSTEEYAGQRALRFATPLGLIAGITVLFLNLSRNPVPFLDDPRGFGTIFYLFSLGIGLIGGGIAYVMGTRFTNERVAPEHQRSWLLGVVPVALAYLVVTALGIGVLLDLISDAFKQLELARLQGVFLTGLFTALVANWIISDALQFSLRKLLLLIVITLSVGMYNSMAGNENPLWWRVSFSYLGTPLSNADAAGQFNATLIFGGLLLIVMQQFLMKDIHILLNHQVVSIRSFRIWQISLILLGVLAALVGLFPSRVSPLFSIIHNLSAYSLAGILFLYMAAIRWLIPQFSKEFYATSLITTIALAGTLIFSAVGYVNTVGLEIIAFVIGGMWLGLFVQNLELLARKLAPSAFAE